MKRAFRKYHRTIGIIICLPLILTVLTGMLTTIVKEWPVYTGISSNLLLKIHTGEILHLEAIYPILNGLGLIGLLVTGMSMSGLFDRKRRRNINN
ncbi:peptidase [Scytonema sp. UIC 10036]|uniref:peptidase n=1 Tax=Scytonema sp. UIC 10036 TaxID=2304196 RepID=UPI0012DAED32|nr:peptidase [Scytonema sp. UIC 10036]MUG91278.1 peptidase [Scytonema sp. UIC 10036]